MPFASAQVFAVSEISFGRYMVQMPVSERQEKRFITTCTHKKATNRAVFCYVTDSLISVHAARKVDPVVGADAKVWLQLPGTQEVFFGEDLLWPMEGLVFGRVVN